MRIFSASSLTGTHTPPPNHPTPETVSCFFFCRIPKRVRVINNLTTTLKETGRNTIKWLWPLCPSLYLFMSKSRKLTVFGLKVLLQRVHAGHFFGAVHAYVLVGRLGWC